MRLKRVTRAVAIALTWACMTTAATWVVNDRGDTGPLEVLTVQPAHATPTVPDPINPAARAQAQRDQQATESHLRATAYWDAARRSTTTTTVVRVAPKPVVVPVARPVSGDGCGGWRDLVDNYAWDVTKACRILLCESGGDPTNYNGRSRGIPWSVNRASGLWQHLPAPADWQDPYVSTALAWSKYSARGWSPWVCQ